MGVNATFCTKTYLGIRVKEEDFITRTEVLVEEVFITRTEDEARWKPAVAQLLKDSLDQDARMESLAYSGPSLLGFNVLRVTADIDDDEKGFWIYGTMISSIDSNGWGDLNPSSRLMAGIISEMEEIMKAAKELGITDRPPQLFTSLYSY